MGISILIWRKWNFKYKSLEFFISLRRKKYWKYNGSSVEGDRVILFEVQSLVSKQLLDILKELLGFDKNRIEILLAILIRYMKIDFNANDVYINITRWYRNKKKDQSDLAIILSLISSVKQYISE